jgi:hypothetical protein
VLSDQDKADAIRIGLKDKGHLTGLSLTPSFGDVFSASLANGKNASSGFSLRIYTPMTWVEQLAADAAKEYRPFTIADVTDEMLEPVLRVIVYPDKPTTLTAAGTRTASSVEHVVLRNKSKVVVQPISKEPFTDTASSALRDMAYQGITATFSLDAVRELRGSRDDQEFSVIVIGEGAREKEFVVKAKHFERLP